MKIERHYTQSGASPYDLIPFATTKSEIRNPDGSVVFSLDNIEVPAAWSQVAADVLAQKYFRKAGVPARTKRVEENAVPSFLWRSTPDEAELEHLPVAERFVSETSARQVFDRLAGAWAYWGWKAGYFRRRRGRTAPTTTRCASCSRVRWRRPIRRNGSTPASTGPMASMGRARAIITSISKRASSSSRSRLTSIPQPHACFIQSVADDLVNEGGIMDLWVREARLFKYGSGTGSNFSACCAARTKNCRAAAARRA